MATAIGWYLTRSLCLQWFSCLRISRPIWHALVAPRSCMRVHPGCCLGPLYSSFPADALLGMTAHRPFGSLSSIRFGVLAGGMAAMFQRLSINKPSGVGPVAMAAMWIGYLFLRRYSPPSASSPLPLGLSYADSLTTRTGNLTNTPAKPAKPAARACFLPRPGA